MAWYQDGTNLQKVSTTWEFWKKNYKPSDEVPVSGIYKCQGCKKEITSNHPDKFPPQNHHQHSTAQGDIRWKLIVRTDTQGKTG